MAVWVKICGITNLDDARAAWDAGADAIGLNFVGGPRRLTPSQARPILQQRPSHSAAVALVELREGELDPILADVLRGQGVRHLQTYGQVSRGAVSKLATEGWLSIVVCRMPPHGMEPALAEWLEDPAIGEAFAILVDAADADHLGGTGRTLDWAEVGAVCEDAAAAGAPPIILAGGLTADNVGPAVARARPWGVDVSSGVERELGRKDHRALGAFVRAAKAVP